MINRYFYNSTLSEFLKESVDKIFGKMSRADEMDTASTQKFAWEQEIQILRIEYLLNIIISFPKKQAFVTKISLFDKYPAGSAASAAFPRHIDRGFS